jgi:hypothetical protein
MTKSAIYASALDARTAPCLHIEGQWLGASESESWVAMHIR